MFIIKEDNDVVITEDVKGYLDRVKRGVTCSVTVPSTEEEVVADALKSNTVDWDAMFDKLDEQTLSKVVLTACNGLVNKYGLDALYESAGTVLKTADVPFEYAQDEQNIRETGEFLSELVGEDDEFGSFKYGVDDDFERECEEMFDGGAMSELRELVDSFSDDNSDDVFFGDDDWGEDEDTFVEGYDDDDEFFEDDEEIAKQEAEHALARIFEDYDELSVPEDGFLENAGELEKQESNLFSDSVFGVTSCYTSYRLLKHLNEMTIKLDVVVDMYRGVKEKPFCVKQYRKAKASISDCSLIKGADLFGHRPLTEEEFTLCMDIKAKFDVYLYSAENFISKQGGAQLDVTSADDGASDDTETESDKR